MNTKERFDVALSKQESISREVAKNLIREGKAAINGKIITKPSYAVSSEDTLVITEKMKYVSRGGYKLEKALSCFDIDLKGKLCIDIGASTGGFTDCMLQHGARLVYAIDVGHSQMAEALINNERVVSFEKINVKNIPKNLINVTANFAAVDVSFISISKILTSVYSLFSEDAVFLIKPQFEAGKNASIKNAVTHEKILRSVVGNINSHGFNILGLIPSPIRGGDGNIEYLIYVSKLNYSNAICINEVVKEAFGKAEEN